MTTVEITRTKCVVAQVSIAKSIGMHSYLTYCCAVVYASHFVACIPGGNSGGSNSGLAVGLTVLVVFLICCCCGCCGGAAGVSSRERDSVHPEPTIVRVVAFGVAE